MKLSLFGHELILQKKQTDEPFAVRVSYHMFFNSNEIGVRIDPKKGYRILVSDDLGLSLSSWHKTDKPFICLVQKVEE
jgi:hypothetical protein